MRAFWQGVLLTLVVFVLYVLHRVTAQRRVKQEGDAGALPPDGEAETNREIVSPQRGGALDPLRAAVVSEDAVEAEIDRDVDGTFPASDPPGWGLGVESGYSCLDKKGDCPAKEYQ